MAEITQATLQSIIDNLKELTDKVDSISSAVNSSKSKQSSFVEYMDSIKSTMNKRFGMLSKQLDANSNITEQNTRELVAQEKEQNSKSDTTYKAIRKMNSIINQMVLTQQRMEVSLNKLLYNQNDMMRTLKAQNFGRRRGPTNAIDVSATKAPNTGLVSALGEVGGVVGAMYAGSLAARVVKVAAPIGAAAAVMAPTALNQGENEDARRRSQGQPVGPTDQRASDLPAPGATNTAGSTGLTNKLILDTIKQKESRGNYTAQNPGKNQTASGAYQFIDETWNGLTAKYGIGTEYPKAKLAPKEIQDAIADRYVSEILKRVGGDVSKVPLVWYTGNAAGKISSSALAVNRGLKPENYQKEWLAIYSQLGGKQDNTAKRAESSPAASAPTATPATRSSSSDQQSQSQSYSNEQSAPQQATPAQPEQRQSSSPRRESAEPVEGGERSQSSESGGAGQFLSSRQSGQAGMAGVNASKLDADFAGKLVKAIQDAEQATGGKAAINEGWRDSKTQAQYYANYTQRPVQWEGETYTPKKKGGIAAPPGRSKHQRGLAADISAQGSSGKVLEWIRARADQYGLGLVANDRPHLESLGGGGGPLLGSEDSKPKEAAGGGGEAPTPRQDATRQRSEAQGAPGAAAGGGRGGEGGQPAVRAGPGQGSARQQAYAGMGGLRGQQSPFGMIGGLLGGLLGGALMGRGRRSNMAGMAGMAMSGLGMGMGRQTMGGPGMIGSMLGSVLGGSMMGRGRSGISGLGMGGMGSLGMLGGMFGLAGAPGGLLNGRGMSPRGLSGGGIGAGIGRTFGGMLGGAIGNTFSGISGSVINNASRELDPARRRKIGDSTIVNNNEAPRGSTPSMGSSSALPSAVPLGQFAEALGRGVAGALVSSIGSHSMSVHRNARSRGWN